MSDSSVARKLTASGDLSNRSVAYLLEPKMIARRCAVADSSRSKRKYQGVVPNASLTLLKPSNPASGSGVAANHSSITGSKVRWITARLVTPEVNDSK